ncbi:MAG TPA: DUF2325 domain-containing protein [Desulfobulbaceae bacterium]|nr:DUF2325 domain-containing protein [Desulfobulbaceae bacterium]
MCIVVIGGMDRLAPHYQEEAKRLGITLRLFPTFERDMQQKLRNTDGVVLFTGKISHAGRREAVNAARHHNIPLYQFHNYGLCTLRDCLRCLHRNAIGVTLPECGKKQGNQHKI